MSGFNKIVNPSAETLYYTAASSPVAITATTQPKVNGGAATNIGTARDTATNPLDNATIKPLKVAVFGSTVIQGASSGNGVSAELPLTAGNFATMTEGEYIIRRVTDKIAGVSKMTLRSGASDYGIRRGIHQRMEVTGPLTATAVRNNQWHVYSGIWTTDPTASTNGLGNVSGGTDMDQSTVASGDHAVTAPGSVEGELQYIAGNTNTILIPVQDEYPAKTTN